MVRIDWYSKGEGTIEVMNNLANYLLQHGMISVDDGCGVQESSIATCEFQVHVIRKKK